MHVSFEALELKLHVPFTISRGTQHFANNVVVELADDGLTGIGEAAPSEEYGEFQGTVFAFLEQTRPVLSQHPSLPLSTLHRLMDQTAMLNPAAKAALDIAAYDLLGKRLDAPLHQILGTDPTCACQTSFTIGIDATEVMAQKAAEARQYPILKVKVGTSDDIENLQAIRIKRPDATIRLDANAAWHPKEAVVRLTELAQYDIQLVEQPVDANDLEGLKYVREQVPVPIIADEACAVPADVPRVSDCADGINIKLMKCGGIYPALQMIHLARAHNLLVMMGCMIESSIAITAAAHLSPLLDYADLDGHLLVDNDPYRGVLVEEGILRLPDGPGLGLSLA